MKILSGLLLIVLFGIGAAEASAQETTIAVDIETPDSERVPGQRTPIMIVHDAPLPAKPAAPQVAAPPAGTKKGAGKAATAAAASNTATPTTPAGPPSPLVMQNASTGDTVHEMGTTGNPKYDALIKQSAARNGIDPNLMVAVMRQESGFNPRAMSYKGATGLMQLMPATAARFGVTNIYDPAQNIEGGARYLRFLLDTFDGDVKLTLAGYNAGENAVVNSGFKIPRYRETQNYVRSISARYDASKGPAKKSAPPKTVAPEAAAFSGGKLSNNY